MANGLGSISMALKFNISDFTKNFERVTTSINSLEKDFARLKDVDSGFSKVGQSLKEDIGNNLEEVSDSAKEARRNLTEIESSSTGVERVGENLDDSLVRGLDNATRQSERTNDSLKKIGKVGDSFSKVGKAMTLGITTPVMGAGTAAVNVAKNLEEGMAKIGTIADTTKVPLDDLKKSIIDMSNKSGESTSVLTESMYNAISAGVDTSEVVQFLNVAVKDAKGGFTDTATAIDGLTSTLNAYGMETSEAMNLSNQMMVAQNLGKTTFGEMASVMGNIAPTANALKVETKELFASLAVLTANGIQTSEAVTGLKAAFSNIIKPSTEATKAAETLGLEFNAASVQSKGWKGFISEVTEKLKQVAPEYANAVQKQAKLTKELEGMEKSGKKNSEAYKKLKAELKDTTKTVELLEQGSNSQISAFATMFGSVEALNTVLTLTSEQGISLYDESIKQMSSSTDFVTEAYEKMGNTTANNMERTKQTFLNTLGTFGEQMLPILTDLLGHITTIVQAFNDLSPATKQAIIGFVGVTAVIGPMLIGLGSVFKAISTIGGGITTVATKIKGLNFTSITGKITNLSNKVTSFGGKIVSTGSRVATTIGSTLGKLATTVSGAVTKTVSLISTGFTKSLSFVMSTGSKMINGIGSLSVKAISGISNGAVKAVSFLGGAFTKLKSVMTLTNIVGFVTNPVTLIIAGITALIAVIVLVVKNWDWCKEQAIKIWTAIKEFFAGMIQGVVDFFVGLKDKTVEIFTNILNFIKEHFTTILTVIAGPIGWIVAFVIKNWDEIKAKTIEIFTKIVDGIKKCFNNIIEGTKTALANFKDGFMRGLQFIIDLPKKALEWGRHMIEGFADGIKGAIDFVLQPINWVADKITSILHFTRPDEGPLREYEEWMPHFMEGMGLGIEKNKYKVIDQIMDLADNMNMSERFVIQPTVRPAYDSFGSSYDSFGSGQYVNNAPILQVDKLYVRDDRDITNISRSIYNENMKVIRGLGRRG